MGVDWAKGVCHLGLVDVLLGLVEGIPDVRVSLFLALACAFIEMSLSQLTWLSVNMDLTTK